MGYVELRLESAGDCALAREIYHSARYFFAIFAASSSSIITRAEIIEAYRDSLGRTFVRRVEHMRASACWITFSLLFLSACEETAPPPPQIRPVRTIVVEKRVLGESTALTGHVRARDEVSLAFRIGGKLIERLVNIGDR